MCGEIDADIQHSVLVRAPMAAVYDALATAEGLDAWFTTGATVDARLGGEIRFRWMEWGLDKVTAEDGGPVLVADRPRRFVFQWSPDDASYATTVEIDLKLAQGGTELRLREHGFHNTPDGLRAMLDCAAGWGEALTLLKFYVERGEVY